MSDTNSNQSSGGWGFGNFFESVKKMSSEVTKMASDLVDKSANEAIRLYGEIKTKGEEMINEINAKELELKDESVTVLPWLLPIFKNYPSYQQMVKEDILMLSNDADTFLKSVEGCDDEQYSPVKNSKLIVLLREQDTCLQKVRFDLVQKQKSISDDLFWRNYVFRVLQIVRNYKQTVLEEEGKVEHSQNEPASELAQQVEPSIQEQPVQSIQPIQPTQPTQPAQPTQPTEAVVEQDVEVVPVETPMVAPKSTIPEVVHTVEDIYDFDDMSDIEKEMGDVNYEDFDEGDLSDLEAEILAEL